MTQQGDLWDERVVRNTEKNWKKNILRKSVKPKSREEKKRKSEMG